MTALLAKRNPQPALFPKLLACCVALCLGWDGFRALSQDFDPISPPLRYSTPNNEGPYQGEPSDSSAEGAWEAPKSIQRQSDLPKIRKLGKLVSIEGESLGPRVYREDGSRLATSSEDTGIEMEYAPNLDPEDYQLPPLSYFDHEPYTDYRTDEEDITYLASSADQFGWFSFNYAPYKKSGYRSGFITGFNLHLLSGPTNVALPSRLYDFSFGYQTRGRIQDAMSYDLASTVGVFSDFEDSARDGVRYPGHAVGMLHYTPEFDLVFGVDYLSRDDVKILPVIGFSWRPRSMEDVRVDMVFPRPRIDYALTDSNRIYLAGRFGGGTWDIEFPDDSNDVMTYRDLQILLGFESRNAKNACSAIEFGYVFDRSLEFRTLTGKTEFDNAFLLRFVSRR